MQSGCQTSQSSTSILDRATFTIIRYQGAAGFADDLEAYSIEFESLGPEVAAYAIAANRSDQRARAVSVEQSKGVSPPVQHSLTMPVTVPERE